MAKATQTIESYFQQLDHPLLAVIQALRAVVLAADSSVAEQVKWNSPSFYYTGPLLEEDPKKYPRDIVVFHLNKKDYVLLVFPSGAKVQNTRNLLEGNYPDGRKMAKFSSLEQVEQAAEALKSVIRDWLNTLKK